MFNLTHDEDSSLDITSAWQDDVCHFKLRHNHDDTGDKVFEFALDVYEVQSLIQYLEFALRRDL